MTFEVAYYTFGIICTIAFWVCVVLALGAVLYCIAVQ